MSGIFSYMRTVANRAENELLTIFDFRRPAPPETSNSSFNVQRATLAVSHSPQFFLS